VFEYIIDFLVIPLVTQQTSIKLDYVNIW